MFCPNCGTQLEDSALFCGSCGTRMNAAEQPQPQQPVYTQASKKNKKPLFFAIGAVAIVAIIAVVLTLFLGGGSSSSAKGAVELYMEVMTGESNNIEDMAPKAVWNYLEEEEGITVKDMREEMEDSMSYLSSMKITYKIGDSESLDKDEVKAVAEQLADKYGLDKDSIKDVKEFEVEMTAKVLGESMTESEDVTVVNVGGSWYCIEYSDYGDGDVYAEFLIAS